MSIVKLRAFVLEGKIRKNACASRVLGHSPKTSLDHYQMITEDFGEKDQKASIWRATLENKGFPEIAEGFSEKKLKINPRFESGKQEVKPSYGGGIFWGAESVGKTPQNLNR
jgi:hypothetical protein